MIDDACIMCMTTTYLPRAHRQIHVHVSHLIGRCTDMRTVHFLTTRSLKCSTSVGSRFCWTLLVLHSYCCYGRSGADREVK